MRKFYRKAVGEFKSLNESEFVGNVEDKSNGNELHTKALSTINGYNIDTLMIVKLSGRSKPPRPSALQFCLSAVDLMQTVVERVEDRIVQKHDQVSLRQ